MKFNSQSNTILNDEFEKKSIKKKKKKLSQLDYPAKPAIQFMRQEQPNINHKV
jgi:hypothetical protein